MTAKHLKKRINGIPDTMQMFFVDKKSGHRYLVKSIEVGRLMNIPDGKEECDLLGLVLSGEDLDA